MFSLNTSQCNAKCEGHIATMCDGKAKREGKLRWFGKLKDWRRIQTRYDRCAHAFMSAIAIAATIIFWINQSVLSLIIHIGGTFADTNRRVLEAIVATKNGPIKPQNHLTLESQALLNSARAAGISPIKLFSAKIGGNVA